MESFERIKIINGHEYVYEITPYYDPETKTTRQRSKYKGKLVDGKAKRMRKALPRNAFDYGELLPAFKVIDELGLEDILLDIFDERRARTMLALAMNRVVHPDAMSNVRSWYERTLLSRIWDLKLSSQALSEFLHSVGDSSVGDEFTQRFLEKVGKGGPLLYDITSLSSTSKLIEMLEYGHNRDGDGLPQMNLSIIAHKDLGIPLAYDVYPGSIADVTTLKNTIARLQAFGLEAPVMVMDRGFYSQSNVENMIAAGYEFIIPAPMRLTEAKTIISKNHAHLEDPENLRELEGEAIFVKEVTLTIGHHTVGGYLYYDLKREQEEKTSFYNALNEVREKLESRTIHRWQSPAKVFEDTARKLAQYFSYTVEDGRFAIEVKKKAVSARLNRCGKMIVLHSGQQSWQECILFSRERDKVEKMFSSLKNDLSALPLRAHSSAAVRGMLFIEFLALIIRMRILAMMRASRLCEERSLKTLFLELSKVRRVELVDGSYVTTELTKRQREIIDALELNIERLCA